jgi:hypothetical protein
MASSYFRAAAAMLRVAAWTLIGRASIPAPVFKANAVGDDETRIHARYSRAATRRRQRMGPQTRSVAIDDVQERAGAVRKLRDMGRRPHARLNLAQRSDKCCIGWDC